MTIDALVSVLARALHDLESTAAELTGEEARVVMAAHRLVEQAHDLILDVEVTREGDQRLRVEPTS